MSRVKRGYKRRRRIKKVFARAEGFFLRRKNTFRRAQEMVDRAGQFSYISRRLKKREFRKLWISRINAAARQSDMSYHDFQFALKQSKVKLDRKVLAEIAVYDPTGFAAIVNTIRGQAAPRAAS